MPSNADISEKSENTGDSSRQPTEHATPEDVPGTGQARRAADAIQSRKDRNAAALAATRKALGR